jgi:hypothetical protein
LRSALGFDGYSPAPHRASVEVVRLQMARWAGRGFDSSAPAHRDADVSR